MKKYALITTLLLFWNAIIVGQTVPVDQSSQIAQQTIRDTKIDSTQQQKETIVSEKKIIYTPPAKPKEKNPLFGYDFFNRSNLSFTPSNNLPTPKNYVIGSGDQLLIEVWGATENAFLTRVDNQGNIYLNGVGKVMVSGLTFEQALPKINSYLKRIYSGISAPDNSFEKVFTGISLKEIRTINVNIIGEVTAPGTYSLNALSSVLNALYVCGGPSETGSFREIKLIRSGKEIATFDIYQYLLNGNETGNLTLQDQDLIIVPPYKNHISVEGSVKRPGIYEILPEETLEDLIGYFGGFPTNAYTKVLTLERIENAQKIIDEVPFEKRKEHRLNQVDKLVVNRLTSDYANRVQIQGAVYQPGNYQLQQGMTLNDLIEKANGIRKEAYLDKGLLFRTENLVDRKTIAFSVKDLLEKKNTIALQNNDSIQIFFKNNLTEKKNIRIEGAVNQPKTISFMENMTVEDAIALAGGLKDGADRDNISISRQLNDGTFENISKVYTHSEKDDKNRLILQPNDIISVHFLKGYTPQQTVEIRGEVAFPGVYTIQSKNETILDLINRAGGLSPFANKKGVTLIRTGEEKSNEIIDQESSGMITLGGSNVRKNKYSVGISLDKYSKSITLKQGDILIVPEEKQTVQIKGEVLSPALIPYRKGLSALECVNQSGGFSNDAKKKALYVIYANGSIKSAKNYIFFTSYPDIEPGAIVVVPKKEERRRISVQETVSTLTSITTLGLLIYNIFK